jgi:2-C-methyl-D-erythritol 2,4-cyclodiphosphate synthase
MVLRIGIGQDIHAFSSPHEKRPLMIGGVSVPFDRGLAGHSDADVLAHAVADALLGAARLGDIGQHFPDSDPTWLGTDSMVILAKTADIVTDAGYQIIDLDCVIVAEKPRLAAYRDEMRNTMAKAMGIDPSAVGIKATTSEGLGFTGRGEGIAATVVALLEK